MKFQLICSLCKRVYTDAPETAENIDCGTWDCTGTLRYLPTVIPMVGDPQLAYGDPRLRGFLIYQAAIAQKRGVVPESLRHGLWAHIW